jgi:hypothetical protein
MRVFDSCCGYFPASGTFNVPAFADRDTTASANMTSVTPGSVGITQAANSVALRDHTDATTATAYSLTQQLVTTAANLVFALVLVIFVFGWTGGRALVHDSYAGAKEKVHKKKGADATSDDGDAESPGPAEV